MTGLHEVAAACVGALGPLEIIEAGRTPLDPYPPHRELDEP